MTARFDSPAGRRVAIAAVAFVLFAGIVAAGVRRGDHDAIGEGRLRTDGQAAITSANGNRRVVSGSVSLHRGDIVEAMTGAMTIELPDGASVEGRPGLDRRAATRVQIAIPVELLAGDLLVTTARGTQVDAGGNRLQLDAGGDGPSAARVSRSLAVAAGVYRGAATIDSAGQTRSVPGLREMEISVLGRPPSAPRPIRLDDGDPWDRRFLGPVMDLGRTLDALSTSYTNSLGRNEGRTVGFFESVLPTLVQDGQFTSDVIDPNRAAGETLVGAAVADLGRRGDFATRWNAAFAFRDEGASWGMVASDQGVAAEPLLAAVNQALTATPFQFAQAAPTPASTGPATTTTTVPSPSPTSPTTTPTAPTPPPTTPPPTTIVPPTGSPLVDGLVSDVNQVIGGLVGGKPPKK